MSDHFRSLFACKQDSACSFIFGKYKYRYDSYNFGNDFTIRKFAFPVY